MKVSNKYSKFCIVFELNFFISLSLTMQHNPWYLLLVKKMKKNPVVLSEAEVMEMNGVVMFFGLRKRTYPKVLQYSHTFL